MLNQERTVLQCSMVAVFSKPVYQSYTFLCMSHLSPNENIWDQFCTFCCTMQTPAPPIPKPLRQSVLVFFTTYPSHLLQSLECLLTLSVEFVRDDSVCRAFMAHKKWS